MPLYLQYLALGFYEKVKLSSILWKVYNIGDPNTSLIMFPGYISDKASRPCNVGRRKA
jgi:hypothetical protein